MLTIKVRRLDAMFESICSVASKAVIAASIYRKGCSPQIPKPVLLHNAYTTSDGCNSC